MNPSLRLFPALMLCFCVAHGARANDDSFEAPDSLLLKNGKTVRGLIIKNSRDAVLLQEKSGETSYPKSEIVRIRDESNTKALFTGVNRKGDLPAWRVIANDLRTHDEIKSLVEIPPTLVDNGVFKNVPYMSFRANRDIELDIYGDPEDPAGFEIGIFGPRSGDDKLRKVIRALSGRVPLDPRRNFRPLLVEFSGRHQDRGQRHHRDHAEERAGCLWRLVDFPLQQEIPRRSPVE